MKIEEQSPISIQENNTLLPHPFNKRPETWKGLTYETYQSVFSKSRYQRWFSTTDAPLQRSLAQPPGTDQTTVYITLLVPVSRDGVTAAGQRKPTPGRSVESEEQAEDRSQRRTD